MNTSTIINVTIEDVVDFYKYHPECIGGLSVETRNGYKEIQFADITAEDSDIVQVNTCTGKRIETSPDHLLWVNGGWCKVKDICIGDSIAEVDGDSKVTQLSKLEFIEDLYDLQVDGNEFIANGIISHNSTILNSLLMCVFDKNLMDIDKNGQINKSNGKNMMITVTVRVDGVYYKIERYRKNKAAGGDGVRLYINAKEPVFEAEHDKTPDSVANTNREIERILGIPYEMFIRIVVFSATHEPFLSLPSSHASKANQRAIIEELFGLTELTHKAELLKSLMSESKSDFKTLNQINAHLMGEHARHIEQINNAIVRVEGWDKEHAEKIQISESAIKELESIHLDDSIHGFEEIEKLEKKLLKTERDIPPLEVELRNVRSVGERHASWEKSQTMNIEELTNKVEELSKVDFEHLINIRSQQQVLIPQMKTLESEVRAITGEISNINTSIIKKSDENKKLMEEIDHLNENLCPYCKQKFGDAKKRIAECELQVAENDSIVLSLHTELDKLNSDKKIKDLELGEVSAKVSDIKDIKIPHNLDTLQQELQTSKQRLEDLGQAVNPHILGEDDLSEEDLTEALEGIRTTVAGIKSKIQMAWEFINPIFKSASDVNNLVVKLESMKERHNDLRESTNPFVEVMKSLNDVELDPVRTGDVNKLDKEIKHQDFLLKLLTKKDSFIRKALLNKNIPLLNGRLRYNLDKIGLPHKVQFNESMEVDISQFGSNYEYGNFSSGQKARVNLCLAFAFRDVLQSRFGKINLCILDECLDVGLGNVGVTQAAKMIKVIATDNDLSMFIISHRDEVSSMFNKRLEIELRNGFSAIITPEEA